MLLVVCIMDVVVGKPMICFIDSVIIVWFYYFVIGSMAVRNENRFVHHPKDHGGIGPFPPTIPKPFYACWLPTFVKQSRHHKSAERALYYCQLRRHPSQLGSFIDGCNFYQWIDGDEMFDPNIMLFPYDPWKSCPYDEFVQWCLCHQTLLK